MWGQEVVTEADKRRNRIIPTRVGTRNSVDICQKITKDHPHACGDKRCVCLLSYLFGGSSPRVWGQAHMISWYTFVERIIPTRVGTSSRLRSMQVLTKDHPHACGDKVLRSQAFFCSRGSSPRVWGQVYLPIYYTIRYRIIPTRVGTSFCKCSKRQAVRDHPHACGDKRLSVREYS